MFREMRRKNQALTREKCEEIFRAGTSGVLAVSGDDGYPYAVPLSYYYEDGRILFHCARAGHKLDAIKREPKASFCVIAADNVVPEEFTTYFKSAIAFGKVQIIEDESKKREAIKLISKKYSPDKTDEETEKEITATWPALCIIELKIEHMTGKQATELTETP
jgi:nitroimidazol reductase NimA-like FMN-containing flavoprotein (pyridoxamine 5'-phosphate oxidase superfamily)